MPGPAGSVGLPLIVVRGLCVRAPNGTAILDGIEFSAEGPELIAILGPSGSGKTTLLRALAGLVPAAAGEVWVLGTCLGRCSGSELRAVQNRLGFVWQDGALGGRLTALTNVLCGRLNRDQPWREWLGFFPAGQRQQAFAALQRLRIGHLAGRRADSMSGGERQRVGIARALHGNPGILLADEPVASLDPRVAAEVLGDLVQLARSERKPTLVSLHQVDFARRFADRVIALNQGRVVFDGPPSAFTDSILQRIYAAPANEVALTRQVPPSRDRVEGMDASQVFGTGSESRSDADVLPPPAWQSGRGLIWGLGIGALYLVALQAARVNLGELARGVPAMASFAWRLLPPQWDWDTLRWLGVTVPYPVVLGSLWETVMMALLGTTLGALGALPLCLLAARNLAPHRALYRSTRLLLNANRAIPDIVFALVLVAAVGLGPFSGTLALGIASVGSLAKVYAEAIESADPAPRLALEATGAGRLFAFRYGLLPQALPTMLSYTLLSFEHNVRSATILGLVGAGGIGFLVSKYLSLFQYPKLSGAILLVMVAVTLLDRLSDALRRRLI